MEFKELLLRSGHVSEMRLPLFVGVDFGVDDFSVSDGRFGFRVFCHFACFGDLDAKRVLSAFILHIDLYDSCRIALVDDLMASERNS